VGLRLVVSADDAIRLMLRYREPEIMPPTFRSLRRKQSRRDPQMAVVTCAECGAKATLIPEGEPKFTYGADFRAKCREVGNSTRSDAPECKAMRLAVQRTLARYKRAVR
jgi:hypothetical protein